MFQGFSKFLGFMHHFVLAKLATSSKRVKQSQYFSNSKHNVCSCSPRTFLDLEESIYQSCVSEITKVSHLLYRSLQIGILYRWSFGKLDRTEHGARAHGNPPQAL